MIDKSDFRFFTGVMAMGWHSLTGSIPLALLAIVCFLGAIKASNYGK